MIILKQHVFQLVMLSLEALGRFGGKSPFFPGVEEAGVASAAGAGSPSGPADQTQDVVSRLSAA
ncbi:jg16549, partial [Pararge aegeria aegeria]